MTHYLEILPKEIQNCCCEWSSRFNTNGYKLRKIWNVPNQPCGMTSCGKWLTVVDQKKLLQLNLWTNEQSSLPIPPNCKTYSSCNDGVEFICNDETKITVAHAGHPSSIPRSRDYGPSIVREGDHTFSVNSKIITFPGRILMAEIDRVGETVLAVSFDSRIFTYTLRKREITSIMAHKKLTNMCAMCAHPNGTIFVATVCGKVYMLY